MGLSKEEYTALHGLGYAAGQDINCVGLFCRRDSKLIDKLSNIFFKTIIEHEWKQSKNSTQCYITSDDPKLCMYSVDAQYHFDSELRDIAEEYASDNDLFLKNVATAWTKLANADRFDGPTGNLCDKDKSTNEGEIRCRNKRSRKECRKAAEEGKCKSQWWKNNCPATCRVCCGNIFSNKTCNRLKSRCSKNSKVRKNCSKTCNAGSECRARIGKK